MKVKKLTRFAFYVCAALWLAVILSPAEEQSTMSKHTIRRPNTMYPCVMRPFTPNKAGKQTDESSDTYDTIEWLLKNIANNNGRAGLWGVSYPAFQSEKSPCRSRNVGTVANREANSRSVVPS